MGPNSIGMGRWQRRDGAAADTRSLSRSPRGGMTLIELLAAMVVLLVGVYSVAALFPKLSRNLTEDEVRTSMGRAAQKVAESYESGVYQAPDSTAPFAVDVDAVDPSSRPADPDATNFTDNPLNARDDFVEVFGERATVPAPATPGGYSCYVPKQGLIDHGTVPVVTELIELKRAYRDPGAGGSVSRGEYYLRPTGELVYRSPAGAGPAPVLLDYEWYDPAISLTKRVSGEYVLGSGSFVNAVTARGGSIVPGNTNAYSMYVWPCFTTRPAVVAGRICWVDNAAGYPDIGQAIYFPGRLANAKVRIDYRVRREDLVDGTNPRRAKIMFEDRVIPSDPPYKIRLNCREWDDEHPLADVDFSDVDVPDVWLVMVDLVDGTSWVWDDGSDGSGAIADVDFVEGVVTINGTAVQGAADVRRMGHPVRMYYRTYNENCVQVQKAPTQFVEVAAGIIPSIPNWEHRQYSVGTRAGSTNTYTYLYAFPAYLEDQAVQVDYTVRSGGTLRHVTNELHVITDLNDPSLGYGFMLNQPGVSGVGEVCGASMRVVGWWRTQTGRIGRVDITSMLFPGA